jgi:hypothetical protein
MPVLSCHRVWRQVRIVLLRSDVLLSVAFVEADLYTFAFAEYWYACSIVGGRTDGTLLRSSLVKTLLNWELAMMFIFPFN